MKLAMSWLAGWRNSFSRTCGRGWLAGMALHLALAGPGALSRLRPGHGIMGHGGVLGFTRDLRYAQVGQSHAIFVGREKV